LIVVSTQLLLLASRTPKPELVVLSAKRRKVALWIVPEVPVTSKRM
jgi:hypothetical protein